MKILQISPQVPFPLSDGGKVGIFNLTKYIALRGHDITLVALDVHGPADVRPLLEFCDLIAIPHSNKNSVPGAIRNLLSDIPYNISKYQSDPLEQRLRTLLARESFEVVHIDHLHMARYGLLCRELAGMPIVLREHNVESVIMERFRSVAKSRVLRYWLESQLARIRRYEAEMAGTFDACCMITARDEEVIRSLQPRARTYVIPAGVEGRYFVKPRRMRKIPNSIALVGDFEWGPSKDALDWFVKGILPKILAMAPKLQVHLIGKNIPEAMSRMGRQIVVRGLVQDFKEELQQYEMLAVPLRVGGGIRLKILESFAMGVPVVSTSIGCEGIDAAHEKHLLIADTEEEFAKQTLRLADDPRLKNKLIRDAQVFVRRNYRWEDIGKSLERVYKDVITAKTGRGRKAKKP
ncbi:MAG: glycosyltransferase family 4 protein [Bacteroidota bacterium]